MPLAGPLIRSTRPSVLRRGCARSFPRRFHGKVYVLFCSPSFAKTPRPRDVRLKVAQPDSVRTTGKVKAHGAIFSAQAVFALWYIVGHVVLSENDPLTFALARELLSAAALLGLARSLEGEISVKSRSDFWDIVVLGALCYGSVMGFMFALAELPEVQVAIAQPLVPALALGFSAMVGLEQLSITAVSGIGVSIAGAVGFTFFNAAGSGGFAGNHTFGYASLVLELMCYAGQLVYLPRLSKNYGPVSLTAMYYVVATIATSATLLVREHDHLDQLASQAGMLFHPVVAATLVFAIVGPTVFNFSAMAYSSKKLKPSISSAYITLQPIMVAILSLMLFGKVLSAQECATGLIVVGGLYLSVIGNPQLDREWADYVSDLPTNVPQTISNAADATVDAATMLAENASEKMSNVAESVSESVAEATLAVKDAVADAVAESEGTEPDERAR